MINLLKFLPKDFTTLRTPFTIFLHEICFFKIHSTSYDLALKHSSFLFKFFSFAFHNINFRFKISKICPKILHFSQLSHSSGNTGYQCTVVPVGYIPSTGMTLITHITSAIPHKPPLTASVPFRKRNLRKKQNF